MIKDTAEILKLKSLVKSQKVLINKLKSELKHKDKEQGKYKSEVTKYGAIIENADTPIWIVDKNLNLLAFNSAYSDIVFDRWGIIPKVGKKVLYHLKGNTFLKWQQFYKKALSGVRFTDEDSYERNKIVYYSEFLFQPIIEDKKITGTAIFFKDISNKRRMENMLQLEKEVFEKLAVGFSIKETFQLLIKKVEEISPEMICSFLLLDSEGLRLNHLASLRLPPVFIKAIDGIEIGPEVGSCGTAAFTQKPVIIPDIQKDARWKNYLQIALKYDLKACWSFPFFSIKKKVKGVFAVYFKNIKQPSKQDLEIVDRISNLAKIIFDRKQSEQTLTDSEERFSAFMDNNPALSWIKDENLNYCYLSKGFKQKYDIELNELGTKNDIDFWGKTMGKQFRKNDLKIISTGKSTETIEKVPDAKGDPVYNLVYKFPIKGSSGKKYVGGIAIDITERIVRENKIAQSEQKYRNLLDTLHEGVLYVDINNLLQFANDRFYEMTGYRESELKGHLAFKKLLDHDGKVIVSQKSKLRKLGVVNKYEVQLRKSSGELIWARINETPYRNEKGVVVGTLATLNDITKQKKTELLKEVSYNIAAKANRRIIDLPSLAKYIHYEIAKVIECKNFYFAILDEKKGLLSFPYTVDELEKVDRKDVEKLDKGIIEYLLLKGKPLIIGAEEIIKIKSLNQKRYFKNIPKSWMGVPLKSEGKTVGLFSVYSYSKENAYSESDLNFLQFVSSQFAIAIERQQMQDEIMKREEYFRTLIENSSDIKVILDKYGKFIYLSDSVFRILGYQPSELIGKSFVSYLHPEELENATLLFQNRLAISGVGDNFECLVKNKKGGFHNMQIITNNLLDNQVINGILLNITDITEKVSSQNQLFLKDKAIESTTGGIIITNPRLRDNPIIYTNQGFLNLTGYAQKEVLGKNSRFLLGSGTEKDTADQIENAIKNKTFFQGEILNYRKDGSSFWNLFRLNPIFNEKKELIHFVGSITNVTELLNALTQLKHKNDELNTFVYKATHDLKGPLASIIGLTELALDNVKDEKSVHYFDFIKESTTRLDKVLTELLEISSLTHGKMKPEKIDLKPLVTKIINSLSHAESFSNVEVIKNLKHKNKIFSDHSLLVSILQNIIDNAVKYKNQRLDKNLVKIGSRDYKEGIIIEIADNGQGIPKQMHEKVFEMFYRGNMKSKGTGLGLYMVKKSLEKLGGTIKMDSEEGKGSRFTIYLPSIKS